MFNNDTTWGCKCALIHDKWQTVTYQDSHPEFGKRNRIREALTNWLNQVETGQIQNNQLLSFTDLLKLSGAELPRDELLEAVFFAMGPLCIFTPEFFAADENNKLLFKLDTDLGLKMLTGKAVAITPPDEFKDMAVSNDNTVLMLRSIDIVANQ